jgi:hypothetical protein
MTRMQDKIVYDLFCILVMLLPRNGYRTNHKQSCPASLSCYYLVMDTEQIINNLVLHPCHLLMICSVSITR